MAAMDKSNYVVPQTGLALTIKVPRAEVDTGVNICPKKI